MSRWQNVIAAHVRPMNIEYRSRFHTPDSVYDSRSHRNTVICLRRLLGAGDSWLAGCYPTLPAPLRRDLTTRYAQPLDGYPYAG
jgi:hypothetical protein